MKLITSITLAMIASASAATLASYTFDTDLSATATDVTASDLSGGPGFSVIHSGTNAITTQGQGLDTGDTSGIFGAISAGEYFTFTVTADAGESLDLTNLTGDFRLRGNGAQDFYFFSDVNGFNPSDVIASYTGVPNGGSAFDIDLSGADYQGLSSITFRVVVDNRFTNTSVASDTGFQGIVLNGDVVTVPEPTSAALLGLGGLTLLARRKR